MTKATNHKKTSSKLGAGCWVLLIFPFAAVGLFMAGMVVRDFWTWSTVQAWVATPAELTHAELHQFRKGTYGIDARYKYQVAGKTYESDRVAVHEGSDNIGSYNFQRGRELERLHKSRQPITCYVNPDDPTQAILYRDLRPGFFAFKLLFALVGCGVGFGMLHGGLRDIRRVKHWARRSHDSRSGDKSSRIALEAELPAELRAE